MQPGDVIVVEGAELNALLGALHERGYETIGPTVRDGGIVHDVIRTVDDLPGGWTDDQEAGRYRLRRRQDEALFGYAVGPGSWKRLLDPPSEVRWRARRVDGGFEDESAPGPPSRLRLRGSAAL